MRSSNEIRPTHRKQYVSKEQRKDRRNNQNAQVDEMKLGSLRLGHH